MTKDLKYQLNLSLPSAFEALISVLTTVIDTIFIAPLGSKYIAVVGAMTTVIELISLISQSVNLTNCIIIARLYGEKKYDKLKITTSTSIYIAIFYTLIFTIFTIIIGKALPTIFNIDKICLSYLFIRLIGIISIVLNTIICGHLRTIEKSKLVLNIKIIIIILKILLNYIVIKLNYGLLGIAASTVILDIITSIILYFKSKSSIIYKFSKTIAKEINTLVKYAIYEKIFKRFSNFVLNIILCRLNTYAYAAHTVLIQIIDVLDNFCHGMGIGISTNVGISFGSKNIKKIQNTKKIVRKINIIMAIICPIIITIILIILLPNLLIEKKAFLIAKNLSYLVIIYSVLDPICYNLSSMLKGTQDLKSIAKINLISDCLLKITLAYILCNTSLKIKGAWISFNIITIISILLLEIKLNKIKEYKSKI